MTTPTGDDAFLHELELDVRTELSLAETSQPQGEAFGEPIDEWLSDPADTQRYEVGLRTLFGAVETLEDGSRPDGEFLPTEVPGRDMTARHVPHGPEAGRHQGTRRKA